MTIFFWRCNFFIFYFSNSGEIQTHVHTVFFLVGKGGKGGGMWKEKKNTSVERQSTRAPRVWPLQKEAINLSGLFIFTVSYIFFSIFLCLSSFVGRFISFSFFSPSFLCSKYSIWPPNRRGKARLGKRSDKHMQENEKGLSTQRTSLCCRRFGVFFIYYWTYVK